MLHPLLLPLLAEALLLLLPAVAVSGAEFPGLPLLLRRCLFPAQCAAAASAGQAQMVLRLRLGHVDGPCPLSAVSKLEQW